MNIYTISQPGKQIVDVQGVAIRTENVQIQIPPALPAFFTIRATQPQFNQQPFLPNAYVNAGTSWQVPTIRYTPFFSSGYCQIWIRFFNQNGTSYEVGSSTNAIYFCGSASMTPGNTTVNRCDIIVTVQNSPLQELRLEGLNDQPCGTWTTRAIDDCRDTEIKCNDPSDPRGFCCIPCDTLNTKLRGLIV